MITYKSIIDKTNKGLLVYEGEASAPLNSVEFPFPYFEMPTLNKILKENIDGTDWKFETGGDEAITALFMMLPDQAPWSATRNTLIYLSLAGERSLLEVLEDATAPDSPYTVEEYAICIWAKKVLSTLSALKTKNLTDEDILQATELRALFN